MKRKSTKKLCAAVVSAGLFGLQGCVSVAPLEPIKNPPTNFRSDSTVAVEFLSPAVVGLRCGERGTSFYGMPVFHAMACGNGKLITMPDACDTFTGGAYADIVCDTREQARELQSTFRGMLISASLSVNGAKKVRTEEKALSDGASITVEFIHPASVAQRCLVIGADLVKGDELYACAAPDRIVLPNPCMSLEGGWYARTLCHEMAHANGWAMDHPGGSFLSDKRAGVDPTNVPPSRAILASLDAGAPLRKASESPVYLAYAAQKEAEPVGYAALVTPAIDTAPASRTAEAPLPLRLLDSIRLLNASMPDALTELRQFAGTIRLPDTTAPLQFASLSLRPKSDLPPAMRLASNSSAVMAPADRVDADTAVPAVLRGRMAADAEVPAPEADAGMMMAAVQEDMQAGNDAAGPVTSDPEEPGPKHVWPQLAANLTNLRRNIAITQTGAALPAAEEASDTGDMAEPDTLTGPETPSLKPQRPALWREDMDEAIAAGV